MSGIRKRICMAVRCLAVIGVIGTLAALPASAQNVHNGTVVTKPRNYTGEIRYKAASQVYAIRSGRQEIEIPVRDVIDIKLAQEPAGLAQAVAAVNAGNFAAAVATLERVKNAYANMGYDKIAGRALVQAYLGMGQAAKAVSMCEALLRANPSARQDGELMGAYVEALIKTESFAKAQRMLDDIIATGSRDAAAIAQVRRGDIDMARGDMREALLNGYLRTIVLFQSVKAVQPEALAKAIKCHTALNEHHYAEKWRRRLLAGYPGSKYAKELSN
jgi:tetratricopeptide (TPR) repeat protein